TEWKEIRPPRCSAAQRCRRAPCRWTRRPSARCFAVGREGHRYRCGARKAASARCFHHSQRVAPRLAPDRNYWTLIAAFNFSICCKCVLPCPPILSTRSATVISRKEYYVVLNAVTKRKTAASSL